MRMKPQKGFTLIELLFALAIMGLIMVSASYLLSSILNANASGSERGELYQEGIMAMDRMTNGLRKCSYVLIPNAHNTTREILAFSGAFNDDDDYYFGDTLFPRIDEDPAGDMNIDNGSGIKTFDDNGDGTVDNAGVVDDDEDGLNDEDILDGIDNDGDGNIDEDLPIDSTNDGKPGIQGMDDDGDGTVDNGVFKDNDEDGSFQEDPLNPLVYSFDSGTNTLVETIPHTGETVNISRNVTAFQVIHEAPERILIILTLTGAQGESVTFREYVHPRNVLQRTGKRVR